MNRCSRDGTSALDELCQVPLYLKYVMDLGKLVVSPAYVLVASSSPEVRITNPEAHTTVHTKASMEETMEAAIRVGDIPGAVLLARNKSDTCVQSHVSVRDRIPH